MRMEFDGKESKEMQKRLMEEEGLTGFDAMDLEDGLANCTEKTLDMISGSIQELAKKDPVNAKLVAIEGNITLSDVNDYLTSAIVFAGDVLFQIFYNEGMATDEANVWIWN